MSKNITTKSANFKNENSLAQGKAPVLNLTIDGSYPEAEVREIAPAPDDAFQTPCSISGVMAGLSGGTLGYAFGFAGHWMRLRLKGSFKGALTDGMASAKTFAIMGGLYAAVGCLMERLRQRHDAWNGAASGCATGLALGWSGGPFSALQSCAMLGAFSYFLDGMAGGGDSPAQAASIPDAAEFMFTQHSPNNGAQHHRQQQGSGRRERSPIELLLTPAIPLLEALKPCRVSEKNETGGSPVCSVGWPFRCQNWT